MHDLSLLKSKSDAGLSELIQLMDMAEEPDIVGGGMVKSFPTLMVQEISAKILLRNYSNAAYQICHLLIFLDQLGLDMEEIAFMPLAGIRKIKHNAIKLNMVQDKKLCLHLKGGVFYFSPKQIHLLLCWLQFILNLLWQSGEKQAASSLKKMFSTLVKGQDQPSIEAGVKQLNQSIYQALNDFILPVHQMTKLQALDKIFANIDWQQDHLFQQAFALWCKPQHNDEGFDFSSHQLLLLSMLDYKNTKQQQADFNKLRPDAPLQGSNLRFDEMSDEDTVFDGIATKISYVALLTTPSLCDIKLFSQDALTMMTQIEALGLLRNQPLSHDETIGLLRFFSLQNAQNIMVQAKRALSGNKINQTQFQDKLQNLIPLSYVEISNEIIVLAQKNKKLMADILGVLIDDQSNISFILATHLMPAPWIEMAREYVKSFEQTHQKTPENLIGILKDENIFGNFYVKLFGDFAHKSAKITRKGFVGDVEIDAFEQAAFALDGLALPLENLSASMQQHPNIAESFNQDMPLFSAKLNEIYGIDT